MSKLCLFISQAEVSWVGPPFRCLEHSEGLKMGPPNALKNTPEKVDSCWKQWCSCQVFLRIPSIGGSIWSCWAQKWFYAKGDASPVTPTKSSFKAERQSTNSRFFPMLIERPTNAANQDWHQFSHKNKVCSQLETINNKKCLMFASLPQFFAHMATSRPRKHHQKRPNMWAFSGWRPLQGLGWRVNKFRSPDVTSVYAQFMADFISKSQQTPQKSNELIPKIAMFKGSRYRLPRPIILGPSSRLFSGV